MSAIATASSSADQPATPVIAGATAARSSVSSGQCCAATAAGCRRSTCASNRLAAIRAISEPSRGRRALSSIKRVSL